METISTKQFRESLNNGSLVFSKGNYISMPMKPNMINRRVKNATKQYVGNLVFDSKLEKDFYYFLKASNINFIFKKKYILIEGFTYNGKKYRDITWEPDFILPDIDVVIDTKGWITDEAKRTIKLFFYYLHKNNSDGWQVWIVHARNQFQKALYCIRRRLENNPDVEQEKYLQYGHKKTRIKTTGSGSGSTDAV